MTKPRKKKISLNLAMEHDWRILVQDGTTVRIGRRFEPLLPLSFDDGRDLRECGRNAVEVFLECRGNVLEDTVLMGEFTPCSGRAVGGRAPAWIFPSMPLDQIEEDELPGSVLSVINGAISNISVQTRKNITNN